MDCKMHASRHLLRGAQGHKTDTQADVQGLEDSEAYHEIPEDVQDSEVESQRRWINDGGHTDRVLERCRFCCRQNRPQVSIGMCGNDGQCCDSMVVQKAVRGITEYDGG